MLPKLTYALQTDLLLKLYDFFLYLAIVIVLSTSLCIFFSWIFLIISVQLIDWPINIISKLS